jgi:hypothetical protein
MLSKDDPGEIFQAFAECRNYVAGAFRYTFSPARGRQAEAMTAGFIPFLLSSHQKMNIRKDRGTLSSVPEWQFLKLGNTSDAERHPSYE